jgi:uncharacterized repeat protein (TIGR01451 family)
VTVTSQGDAGQSDSSTLTTTVNSAYGVLVSPASDSQSGDPGEVVTYTLMVINTGNVTDTFDVAVSGNTWGTSAPSTVGPLGSDASQTIDVSVTIPPGASGGDMDTANVTVTSAGDAGQSDSSTLTTSIPSLSFVDLEVSKSAEPLTVTVTSQITYTLVVTNHGPSMATNIILTDTLPTQVEYDSDDSGCVHSFGIVTCDLGSLGIGESDNVMLVVTANAEGLLTNTAEVGSDQDESDEDWLNNTISIESFAIYLRVYLPLIMN